MVDEKGFTFGLILIGIFLLSIITTIIFSITSSFFTYLGLILGNILGNKIGTYSKLIGGVILISIAIMTFVT